MRRTDSRVSRILLVDDHALVRSTVASTVEEEPDLTVVATASNAQEAVHAAIREHPDVIVMDVDMPGLICFDAARQIGARCHDTKLLFLSAFTNDHYISQAIQAGARGYLTKAEPPAVLIRAIREVAAGGSFFSAAIVSRLIVDKGGIRLATEPKTRASRLTQRELEVLRYVARGHSKKDIARTMHLSTKTVDNHCSNLMSKLDIHDRVELARFAIREGLTEA